MTALVPSSDDRGYLLVIGSVPELDGGELDVIRRPPDEALVEASAIDALVLDLRSHTASALAVARKHPALLGTPALLVTREDAADAALLRDLDALDVLRLGRRDEVRTQLAVVAELGRTRRALRRTEQSTFVAMGTMVAGFAHEIRNPVAALLSIVEEVGEELTAAGRELPHVGRMVQILQRIERLVQTSLEFGQPAAPRRARHRPSSIAARALTDIGRRTHASGQELRVEIERELPEVFCDDAQIAQVLVIFLNNALDATGSPSRVQLRARLHRRTDDRQGATSVPSEANRVSVRFEVEDDGAGIPPEILGRIFDPFFTTKAGGTGLGLSIAQQIVRDNGGHLEVTSARGGPTTFGVILPAKL